MKIYLAGIPGGIEDEPEFWKYKNRLFSFFDLLNNKKHFPMTIAGGPEKYYENIPSDMAVGERSGTD